MTYLSTVVDKYKSESHHAFLLHGNTRDLQIGDNGSCSLVDHMLSKFAQLKRVPVVFRVGIGWRFAVESDRSAFLEALGIGEQANSDFAGLGEQEDPLPLDALAAIGLIDLAMKQTKIKVTIILDRLELIVPNNPYDRLSSPDKAILSMLQMIAVDSTVIASGNMILGIVDNLVDIHESIKYASSRWFAVEVLPPDYEERLSIASQVLPSLANDGIEVSMSSAEFAQATSMLPRYGLMDIFSDATAKRSLSREQVRNIKALAMSQEYGDILQTLDPLPTGLDDIAGMEELKRFVTEDIVDKMIAGKVAEVPSGVLFAGAPGLGKSYFMRGVAGHSGLPVINFQVGKLLGSYVGQSERNLERAITAIISAAPALVVLDEIETTFPDRANAAPSGDSGVSSRILKRMLEVLSDPALRGRVVWIGITNYPQRLDAALSRAGRFDLTVAFLPPVEGERADLIEVYARKYKVSPPLQVTLEVLAKRTAGYTNAELENLVRKAQQMHASARFDGMTIEEKWLSALERVRANTRGVWEMTDAALLAVNDADLLHPDYFDRWKRVTNQVEEKQAPGTNPATGNRGSRAF